MVLTFDQVLTEIETLSNNVENAHTVLLGKDGLPWPVGLLLVCESANLTTNSLVYIWALTAGPSGRRINLPPVLLATRIALHSSTYTMYVLLLPLRHAGNPLRHAPMASKLALVITVKAPLAVRLHIREHNISPLAPPPCAPVGNT